MLVPRFKLETPPAGVEAVRAAYAAGEHVAGPAGERFEAALCARFGRRHCVLTNNGFSALHLTLEAIGVRGRAVYLPAVSTCFAVLNAVLAAGGVPRFGDLDGEGRLVPPPSDIVGDAAAILAPAHFGLAPDVAALAETGVPLLLDAAQAALSLSADHALQDGAAATVLSFYPTKLVGAIDGGAVLTDDPALAELARDRVYYGHQRQADGVPRFNYRLANLHAVAGLAHLDAVDEAAERQRALAALYRRRLGSRDDVSFVGLDPERAVPSRLVLRLRSAAEARRLEATLIGQGLGAGRELLALAPTPELYPQGFALLETTVSLPLYPSLPAAAAETVIDEATRALDALAGDRNGHA